MMRHQFHPETEWKVRCSDGDYAMEPVPRDHIDELDRIHQERLRRVFQSRTSEWEQPPEYWRRKWTTWRPKRTIT